MSSPTYSMVRVLDLETTWVHLLLARVPEPPFDDPLTKGLALMLLCDHTSPEAPINALSLDDLITKPRPPDLIDTYIASVQEVARRNVDHDFYENCRKRFGKDDTEESHQAYCAYYSDESRLFQVEMIVTVTNGAWLKHITMHTSWPYGTTAYAPEIYD